MVATPPLTVAVTPAPTKFRVTAEPTRVPSSLTGIDTLDAATPVS